MPKEHYMFAFYAFLIVVVFLIVKLIFRSFLRIKKVPVPNYKKTYIICLIVGFILFFLFIRYPRGSVTSHDGDVTSSCGFPFIWSIRVDQGPWRPGEEGYRPDGEMELLGGLSDGLTGLTDGLIGFFIPQIFVFYHLVKSYLRYIKANKLQ
ncbi:MAG: hypothetical protein HQK88_02800 [Nitrospirae bacterium]|nr:hypothetical protein [Nitrospirota bacterium]MBF0534292.1 hypothetical protein [Nitrospirota bacterium]MBF0615727.1 hypothetical protein [Nitrospirota bacterium]